MHYVIIRDDDTNAFTPVECLERLYRPLLDCGFPVNLATIPNVRTDVRTPDGKPEGFLVYIGRDAAPSAPANKTVPLITNPELLTYLKQNPEYKIVQHGFNHDYFEFDMADSAEIARRLDEGAAMLDAGGLGRPQTFVAPHDKLSRAALREVRKRFRVLSTGWYELKRLPPTWWPRYLLKRSTHRPHWQVSKTMLLTHPGCLLSCHRDYGRMLDTIEQTIRSQKLTVLVTHWWEYFRDGTPDERFIAVLHQTANLLASDPDIRVISFDDLIDARVDLN